MCIITLYCEVFREWLLQNNGVYIIVIPLFRIHHLPKSIHVSFINIKNWKVNNNVQCIYQATILCKKLKYMYIIEYIRNRIIGIKLFSFNCIFVLVLLSHDWNLTFIMWVCDHVMYADHIMDNEMLSFVYWNKM